MRADTVRPRTWGSQGHKVTSNTQIDQSVNHTGNGSSILIYPRFKNSNLGSENTVVHLCSEVPHELPEGRRPKPINI